MKKKSNITTYTLTLACILSLTGCSNYLNESPLPRSLELAKKQSTKAQNDYLACLTEYPRTKCYDAALSTHKGFTFTKATKEEKLHEVTDFVNVMQRLAVQKKLKKMNKQCNEIHNLSIVALSDDYHAFCDDKYRYRLRFKQDSWHVIDVKDYTLNK